MLAGLRWSVASAMLLAVLWRPAIANACSMVEPKLEQRLEAADIVVHGVVVGVGTNRAELTVHTAFRGHTGESIEVENRKVWLNGDCSQFLSEDGRFVVGDELLLFLHMPEDGGLARPVGALGDGAFRRTSSGFAWAGVPEALFDADAMMAFAGHNGNLHTATRNADAREYVDQPPEPPPLPPQAARGCRTGGDERGRLGALVGLLVVGLLVRRRAKRI